ncbi:hypothetical protein [Singulisphaera sp. PoT]|uniref:hypothetical protein n=1 Tax=Singulisphaera sp. PoT TaxID=3411797 RepID=UPI003BF4637C
MSGVKFARVRLLALGMLASLAIAGCSGGADDGLTKYPVHGTVYVNGKAADGMVVTFNHQDKVPGNAMCPVARTDQAGHYTLSTNADKDGAVEGEYTVTFVWPTDNGPMPLDRLKGRLANAERSSFKAHVKAGDNEIEPFKLEIEPRNLLPPPTKAGARQ